MRINHLRFVSIVALMAITPFSCNIGHNKTNQTPLADDHTSQSSLDWQGTYSGHLPYANNGQMETELTLTSGMTYVLIIQPIGKNRPTPDTLKGKFTWNGSKIKLEGIPQNKKFSMFKVEENQVRRLDMEGNEITGDLAQNNVIRKNGNTMVENKRWQIIELNGKEVKGTSESHYLIFHAKDGRLEAKANCNILLYDYKIKNGLQIKIEPGISTMMACPDNLEHEFSQALIKADNLSTDEKTLSLNKARMAPLARFKLVEE